MSDKPLGPLAYVRVNVEGYTGFDISLARPGNGRWIATVHGPTTGSDTEQGKAKVAEAEDYARLFRASPALLAFAQDIALGAVDPDKIKSRAREVVALAGGGA